MTTTTTTAISRPLFPATAAVWRFFRRCLRWLRRNWWKIALWIITLTALAWQYENWHGRSELAEQRALWRAEYGEMKQSDLAPPRILDDENFFAAPVFETFVVKEPRKYTTPENEKEKALQEDCRKGDEMADALPHGRFLRMQVPAVASSIETVPDVPGGEGVDVLDIPAWAQSARDAGHTRPGGLTDAQWLSLTFPPDSTVKGFITALSRRKARLLPHPADRWKVGEQLGAAWASPIPAMSNMFAACRSLAFRARAAARAGDRVAARQFNEVLWLLTEGLSGGDGYLVETLVALAWGGVAESPTVEGLACRCWNETDLAILSERLAAIDEERTVFTGLFAEAFNFHWSGSQLPLLRNTYLSLYNGDSWVTNFYFWMILHGPQGWDDSNLANQLRMWRLVLIPDSPGDDLLALKQKVDTGLAESGR